MEKYSASYELAKHLHGSFLSNSEILTTEQLIGNRDYVWLSSSPNHTQKLYTNGVVEGKDAAQTLSRAKDGVYYFTTIFSEFNGKVITRRISENSGEEYLEELVDSLYFRRLAQIAFESN